MYKLLSPAWYAHAVLVGLNHMLADAPLEPVEKMFGDNATPQFADPNGPWNRGMLLADKHQTGSQHPTPTCGEHSGIGELLGGVEGSRQTIDRSSALASEHRLKVLGPASRRAWGALGAKAHALQRLHVLMVHLGVILIVGRSLRDSRRDGRRVRMSAGNGQQCARPTFLVIACNTVG